jgi:hypothetical protein
VDKHLESVIDTAGRVDISFNAIGIPNPKIRVPLVELDVEQFSLPITMTVTATISRTGTTPWVGGGGPAMAAVEALTRELSAELAPEGIRVVGLRPQGIPETDRIKESFELYANASGMTWEQFHELLASTDRTDHVPTRRYCIAAPNPL